MVSYYSKAGRAAHPRKNPLISGGSRLISWHLPYSENQKGANSLVILGAWTIWKKHNDSIFNGASPSVQKKLTLIEEGLVSGWSSGEFAQLRITAS